MSDEQWTRGYDAMTEKGRTTVSLRQVLGTSPPANGLAFHAGRILSGVGWLMACVVIVGGSLMMWQLIFSDSVGGDPWLGRPADVGDTLDSKFSTSPPTTPTTTTAVDATVVGPLTSEPPPTRTTLPSDSATASSLASDSPGDVVEASESNTTQTTTPNTTQTTTPNTTQTTTPNTTQTTTPNTTQTTTPTSSTIDDGSGGGNSGSGGSGTGGGGGGADDGPGHD